ncbi:hypothetical protein [Absidia glauca]|uniref:Uncharacterized protein n=1 Tax=Absidia glauca TaxID=4829 RepID=A0A168KME2_ABSGL|nr:hypothetical protein [Absidia glauca]
MDNQEDIQIPVDVPLPENVVEEDTPMEDTERVLESKPKATMFRQLVITAATIEEIDQNEKRQALLSRVIERMEKAQLVIIRIGFRFAEGADKPPGPSEAIEVHLCEHPKRKPHRIRRRLYCKDVTAIPWSHGHRCEEYLERTVKQESSFTKAKAARITKGMDNDDIDEAMVMFNMCSWIALMGLAVSHHNKPPTQLDDDERNDIPKPNDSSAGTDEEQKAFHSSVPESVVMLDTPQVDEAAKNWYKDGTIVKARVNTEWNSPLMVAPKRMQTARNRKNDHASIHDISTLF